MTREKSIERHKKYYLENKEKVSIANYKWEKDNPEKVREKKHRFYLKHKEDILMKARLWRKEHPLEAKAWYVKSYLKHKEKNKRKYNEDPFYRLNINIPNAINGSLRKGKNRKKWEEVCGFTLEELKWSLEKQFVNGMTWKNYGLNGWHIDHIIPISAFNFKSIDDLDFKRCWALNNLRPLWADENRRKHSKVIHPFQPSLPITAVENAR